MSVRLRIALVLLVTVAHRAFLAWATYIVHPDAGTAAIMALDILEGERPLFMYGFNYSGSLIAYLIAISFRCFGVSVAAQLLPGILLAAGWVGATYLLFRDLFNRRAGLAAALAIAIPDWVTARYSMIPDCSYSPLFFLVTLALWLCVRIAMGHLRPSAFWAHTLALGFTAGLAMWTHPIAAAYLLCGLGILLPLFIRRRFHRHTILPFLAGGVLFAFCVLPYLYRPAKTSAGALATDVFRPEVIQRNYIQLTQVTLPRFAHWPIIVPPAFHALAEAAILLGALFWFLRILTGVGRNDRLWAASPLFFCAVYLALFLPLRVATTGYLRYAIPVWTMIMWGITAVPISSHRKWVRIPGTLLLGFWLVYNSVVLTLYAAQERPLTAARLSNLHCAVDRADELGLSQVITVGDYYDGMESQALTFFAENRIRFTYAGDERQLANAQAADIATHPAFAAFTAKDLTLLTQTFDALGATYLIDKGPWMKLVYDVHLERIARRALLPQQMLVYLYRQEYGSGEDVLDRTQASYISGSAHGETAMLLDLGTQREIVGLACLPQDPMYSMLPTAYTLEGSEEGSTFHLIRHIDHSLPLCYAAGNMMYFGGEYGRVECRFPPQRVRYLRLTEIKSAVPDTPWHMSELYVFEHLGEVLEPNSPPIVAALSDIEFTAADRWLSAHLLRDRATSAWPRYNTHLQRSGAAAPLPARTMIPDPTHAIAVERALADDLESVLRTVYGEAAEWTRTDVETYSLFKFQHAPPPGAPALQWNGLSFVR